MTGSWASCNFKKKKKNNEAHPNRQFSQTSVPTVKMLSFPGDSPRNIIFHKTTVSLLSLDEESSQRKLQFYGRLKVVPIRILFLKLPGVPQKNRKSRTQNGLPLTFALISIFNMDPIIVIRSLIITRTYHPLMNSHWSVLHTCRLYFSRKKLRNLCGKHFKKHFLQTTLPSGRRRQAQNSALTSEMIWRYLSQPDRSSSQVGIMATLPHHLLQLKGGILVPAKLTQTSNAYVLTLRSSCHYH